MQGALTKKAVCQSFAKVVRRSPLKDSIDPKAFFMMLVGNYAVLCQKEQFDFEPIWKALSANHEPAQLYGLFYALADRAAEMGLTPALPAAVSQLSEEEKKEHLDRYALHNPDAAAEVRFDEDQPAPDELNPEDFDASIPLSLSTGDLKPFIPDELKRTITLTAVQAIRAGAMGDNIDAGDAAYLIDDNFDDLCDATSFSFDPILAALRETPNATDSDIYAVVVRLRRYLAPLEIEVATPKALDVSPAMREQIEKNTAREDAEAVGPQGLTGLDRKDGATPPPPKPDDKKSTAKERQLKKYGLSERDRRWKYIRHAALTVVLVGAGAYAYLTRPSRPLSLSSYAAVFPLSAAELKDGVFTGTMDDSQWYELSVEERNAKLTALQEMLKGRRLITDMQIRDQDKRLVVTAVGSVRIIGAKFLMLGNKDGTIPKAEVPEEEKEEALPAQPEDTPAPPSEEQK